MGGELFDVEGTTVLITGAGRGIGCESAELMAAHGANIVACDISESWLAELEERIRGAGGTIATVVADVREEADVERLVATACERFGRIDALVNNVGGSDTVPASFEEMSLDYWREILRLNLSSQFLVTRGVIPVMRRQRSGRIVNVSSLAGTHGSWRAGSAYCAAKAGVITLTKSFAAVLGSDNIVVNAIAQSDTLTERTDELFESSFWTESREAMMARYEQYPIPRPATPLDVARGIAFLCSPGADYTTGLTLYLDGGARFAWSCRLQNRAEQLAG